VSVSPDIQSTFDYLFDRAKRALEDNRSFAPFAACILVDGARTHSSADLPAAASTPADHIGALLTALHAQAREGGLRAAGIVFDSVAPADVEGGPDAVCVHAETASGEAVQIFVPYARTRSPLPVFARPVIQDVAARIFAT
jgi:hypothetical protein